MLTNLLVKTNSLFCAKYPIEQTTKNILYAGQLFEPSGITVSDYLDQWYDLYCKPNLKYNTQVSYLGIMEGHLKGNEIQRIVPIQKCVESALPRVRMVCIAENGEYTSTDSFKYCARVIHKELLLAFDFHSLRQPYSCP